VFQINIDYTVSTAATAANIFDVNGDILLYFLIFFY